MDKRLLPELNRQAIPIVLWNLTPVLGVLLFEWQPVSVFICYALETIVIGIFNVFRLTAVYYYGLPQKPDESGVSGLAVIPFFIFHYFFFVFVQLSIFFPLSGVNSFGPFGALNAIEKFMTIKSTNAALVAFVVSCAYSFITDFILTGAYTKKTMLEQMFEPYPRIFVQQFVVILGSMVFSLTGNGWFILVIFIAFKMYLDLLLKDADLIAWAREQAAKEKPDSES
ncbi:MAG: hypothetical protein KIS94_14715 [Chitinophagales bacterium]|nr:hypothetical protein [Chitinophagales bacterium]